MATTKPIHFTGDPEADAFLEDVILAAQPTKKFVEYGQIGRLRSYPATEAVWVCLLAGSLIWSIP